MLLKKNFQFLLIIVLIFVVFLSFLPAFFDKFIDMDDAAYIFDNPDVKIISLKSIQNFFTRFYVACYVPLPMLSFAAEYAVFKDNPLPYHTTNVVLHELNCLLVFWLVLVLGETPWLAFLVALLFGIHPLKVESVAWVVGRKDLLYALFFLGALISYGYYVKRGDKKYYYWSLILFILAAFSKVQAFVLPFILFLIDYLKERRLNGPLLKEKIPFLIIGLVCVLVGIWAQRCQSKLTSQEAQNLLFRFMAMNYLLVFYLQKLLWPAKLSFWYVYYGAGARQANFLGPNFLFSLLVMAVIFLILAIFFRKNRKVIFGAIFFFVTIFPVIKPITLAGEVIAADRYTYLPSIGFLYLACYFFDRIFQRSRRVVSVRYLFFGILFVLIVFLSFLTWRRNFVFRDRVTLWDDVLKNYPFTAMAYMRRANYYFGKSQFEKTIQDMEVFLKMFPEDPEAHYLKGLAHKYLKEYQQAFFEFNRAAELKPSITSVYLVRGRLFGLLKDYERAEADFKKAAALEPDNGQAYYNLALVAYYKGKKALVGPLIKKSQNLGYKIDPLSLMVISSVPKK